MWHRHGTVLRPRAGEWDARGARVSAVVSLDPLVVLYDGRRTAADNWHERTGLARGGARRASSSSTPARACSAPRTPTAPSATPRQVTLPDGTVRCYAEMARPDGAHDLVVTAGVPS